MLGLAQDPSVKAVLDLVHPIIGHLDLGAPGALLGGPAGGLVSLIQLVGGLMAVESISREIERFADLVVSMLATDTVQALTAHAAATRAASPTSSPASTPTIPTSWRSSRGRPRSTPTTS